MNGELSQGPSPSDDTLPPAAASAISDDQSLTGSVRDDASDFIESYLTRHRPGGRTGKPSYAKDEVWNFATALVRHQLEGVRNALREHDEREQGLKLDLKTMLPSPLPAWLEHSRDNIDMSAPLKAEQLADLKEKLRSRIRQAATQDGGLHLDREIVIRRKEDGNYWACYVDSVIEASRLRSESIRKARADAWSLVSTGEAAKTPISELVHDVAKCLDSPRDIAGSVSCFVSLKDQAAASALTCDRRAVAAVRQQLPWRANGTSLDVRDLDATRRAMSKLASQARPGSPLRKTRLYRMLTLLSFNAVLRALSSGDGPSETPVAEADKVRALQNFILERIATLRKNEQELGAGTEELSRCEPLCTEAERALAVYYEKWMRCPTPPSE